LEHFHGCPLLAVQTQLLRLLDTLLWVLELLGEVGLEFLLVLLLEHLKLLAVVVLDLEEA